MKKLITFLIFTLCLLSLGFSIHSQREDRPGREWWIYFLDEKGEKRSVMIERTYAHEALETFHKHTAGEPDIRVTCITNPHWNYCVEREW